jgi:hypothetical protein
MGGIVDPKTGKVIWEFHVPLEEQLVHYRGRPPSCLGKLRCTPVELPGFAFDGHGEPVNVIFELACPCGGKEFTAMAHFDDDDDEWPQPPLVLFCEECDQDYEVFDASRHGFDAVMGGLELEAECAEREIGADSYEILVRFEFPSDHLGDERYKGIEHHLFSWITFVGRDAGELVTLFDYECA